MALLEADMRQDVILARYLEALETGDLDILKTIWDQAAADPELEKALAGFNEELLLETANQPRRTEPEDAESEGRLDQERLLQLSRDLLPPRQSPDEVVDATFSNYRCTVLVVDDLAYIRQLVRTFLAAEFQVFEADSVAAAQAAFAEHHIDVLLTDQRLRHWPGPEHSGVDLVEWARQHHRDTVPILMTAYDEPDDLINAINRGHIFYYVAKPFPSANHLLEVVRQAAHVSLLERKNREMLTLLKQMNMDLDERVRSRTRELVATIHELQQKAKMLDNLAMTDQLTGLPNRRAMDNLATRELLWRRRYPGPLAIGLIDIDHFKRINQEYLWRGGDKVLTEVCRCMQQSIRTIDFVGRYGGEEFMLIAPQTDVKGAESLGERIRHEVEKLAIPYKGQTIRVTVSLGFAVADSGVPAEFDQMRDVYEEALSRAKEVRNRCCVSRVPVGGTVVQRARG